MKTRSIFYITCLLMLACTTFAQEAQVLAEEGGKVKNPPESLQLEYKFKVGEYRRYDMSIIGEGVARLPGQTEQTRLETRTDLVFAQHAESYDSKTELWHMEWDMINGVLTLPEFGDITLTIPSLTFEMDKAGNISKVKGLDDLAVTPVLAKQDSMVKALGQLTSFGFPKKPVKVGDIWKQEYRIEVTDQEPVLVKTVSEIAGYEVMEGADCAKIVTKYETPFKLKSKAAAADPQKSQGADDAAKEQKTASIAGVEKGEFCMHFDYEQGRVMRISGTVTVMADMDDKEAVAESRSSSKAEPTSEEEAERQAKIEMLKHDVGLKYTMTSVFNPKMPVTAVEKPKK